MPSTPPLVSVIGSIEAPLLAAWVRHYRLLGIERFLIAFHFPRTSRPGAARTPGRQPRAGHHLHRH
ncbi:hypothetical protein [Streptomyces sp. 049-1]|uniref:hypothetical protein n=1 Tax=Streptomyces sp. 049-1 TaxID=2789264 RepID=UPI0039813192